METFIALPGGFYQQDFLDGHVSTVSYHVLLEFPLNVGLKENTGIRVGLICI